MISPTPMMARWYSLNPDGLKKCSDAGSDGALQGGGGGQLTNLLTEDPFEAVKSTATRKLSSQPPRR
jgi:hypothetical protein